MKTPSVSYRFDPRTSDFAVENYAWAPPFSSFLPGIAGLRGIPLWVFFVSRGQAVSSLGVADKDRQILEFHSFNRACDLVGRTGYRTFLRLDGRLHEPFRRDPDPRVAQTLSLSAGEIELRERHPRAGVETVVTYVPLVEEPIGALLRIVRVRNLTRRARNLEWVDGLPRILPHGLDQKMIKGIPRHAEAMMGAVRASGGALFRLRQTAADREEVAAIEGGTFFVAPGARLVLDPETVFGEPFEHGHPRTFADGGAAAVRDAREAVTGRTPSAMALRRERLPPDGEVVLVSAVGHVDRDADLSSLARRLGRRGWIETKRRANRDLLDEISDRCLTVSSEPVFDAFSRRTFLDNAMRGGVPRLLPTAEGPIAFYSYARQNGDLERDYHHFVLEPTYLSQGTGHYRSVLQNRRTDPWFFPEVGAAPIRPFIEMIQLDGYNPLEVRGFSFRVENRTRLRRWIRRRVRRAAARAALEEWMSRSFTPGELLLRLERLGARSDLGVLDEVMPLARTNEVGAIHEGFWVDHWHYLFDLLEVALGVWPDRLAAFLLGERYTWFDDPDEIAPRDAKTLLLPDGRVRRYGAVVRNAQGLRRIESRRRAGDPDATRVRTRGGRAGRGAVLRSTLLAKLLTIVANRLATLDPSGLGIDMEAGKPGWNDSMNGLPALFGSGLAETLELRRAVGILIETLPRLGVATVEVPAEVAGLLFEVGRAIARRRAAGPRGAFRYWDETNALKERTRARTRSGVSGRVARPRAERIRSILASAARLLDEGFEGAARRRLVSSEGVPHTYFVHEALRTRAIGTARADGATPVRPGGFRVRPIRSFLEGPVHWMKVRPQDAAKVYRAVRRSPLYDRKLRMFKNCVDMRGETPELGRAVGAYPRGWIENESIYLHMEYKWRLEVLRSGLSSEFWRDARESLIPFLDPARYGRSTLEGASFVVSSAYADPRLHGRAFQPRLSGFTVEVLHLWTIAVAGPAPIRLDSAGRPILALDPRLPAWLFTRRARTVEIVEAGRRRRETVPAGAFAFRFLGSALVVYRNPARRDTYGARGVRPVAHDIFYRDGRRARVECPEIPPPHAAAIRAGEVRRIDVKMGSCV